MRFPPATVTGYQAAPGWDLVTGWGSPNAEVLRCSHAPAESRLVKLRQRARGRARDGHGQAGCSSRVPLGPVT
jgi:hypothetical protein